MVWEELADVDSCCERGCVSFHKAPSWRNSRRLGQDPIVSVVDWDRQVCTVHYGILHPVW